MCVVYKTQERKYGLTILDFGNSMLFHKASKARQNNDVICALEIVRTFAGHLKLDGTGRFASSIINDHKSLNRETILDELRAKLNHDLRRPMTKAYSLARSHGSDEDGSGSGYFELSI